MSLVFLFQLFFYKNNKNRLYTVPLTLLSSLLVPEKKLKVPILIQTLLQENFL